MRAARNMENSHARTRFRTSLPIYRCNVTSADQDHDKPDIRFVIRPNCSLSWNGALVFFAGMFTVSMTIAIVFAFMGAWMVLPFAGLEMLVLWIGLYLCAKRTRECEVVAVHHDRVEVQKGRVTPRQTFCFQRAWARVALYHPGSWYPSRLSIRAHGRDVVIGGCLNDDERRLLAKELTRALCADTRTIVDQKDAVLKTLY